MTPSDDFYNIPLSRVIEKAQRVKQGAASPTTEEFDSSNFVNLSMLKRVESLKGNLKPLSEYLEFVHDILSINEDQPPKELLQKVNAKETPLVFVDANPTYSLDALPNLIFTYNGKGISVTGEMDVHHFWAGNVWRKEVLCTLTNHTLLDILSTLKS
ncbi:hypothetical protein Pcinc_044429 [Petrolisthes cinctipes]|uniref:Uncharacterized protein n=1 Tax=Petrolisthes cinctipes TaxID=88211 RepID=A0AAE1BE94_PETCI|nr:hypothetical protein Pcinc_044429 [Petrolisthes cinctipes]